MKNIKILITLLSFVFFTQTTAFAQSDECQEKMQSMAADFQKQMESASDLTREKADAMMEEFTASAKKKFPECFPKDFEAKKKKEKEKAERDVQAKKENLVQAQKQEIEKQKKKEEVAEKKVAISKPKELTRLEKKRETTNKNESQYKAFRKECMRDMQSMLVELREKSLKYLEEATNPAEQKEVRKAFEKAKSRILHDCAILKLEELKKS